MWLYPCPCFAPLHDARQTLRDDLTDESLRVAILLGLATIPVTLFLSWESIGSEANASASALFVAGLYAGYYYSDREPTRRRAGIWTGLAGSIGVVILTVADTAAQVVRFGPDWSSTPSWSHSGWRLSAIWPRDTGTSERCDSTRDGQTDR